MTILRVTRNLITRGTGTLTRILSDAIEVGDFTLVSRIRNILLADGMSVSDAATATYVPGGGSFTPLIHVNFDGLSNGQSVVATTGGSVAGKRFNACPSDISFAGGFGMQATTALARPGKSSCCAISIKTGSDGDPAQLGAGTGAFGGTIDLGANSVVEGEEMWWGQWMYFPTTWLWGRSGQTLIKFFRLDHTFNSAHLDLYIITGAYGFYGNGDSSAAAADKQAGWWWVNEYSSIAGSPNTEPSTKLTSSPMPGGQWCWVERYVKAHSDPAQTAHILWVDGVYVREQRHNFIRWRNNAGTLKDSTTLGLTVYDDCTLSNSSDIISTLRLFTYWNAGAPQDQTCYVGNIAFHKNSSTLPGTDEFGNKMMGTGAV